MTQRPNGQPEYQGTGDFVELPISRLVELGRTAYESVGLSSADAILVVESQLASDVRGIDTHGFQRLSWYLDRLRTGENNPSPEFRTLRESPVSLLLDCDNALGQLACTRVMEMTIEKAQSTGLAVGVTIRSNDWGRGAYYPTLAAEAGFISFGATTSVPHIAPFGSRTRLVGNNPMVYAIPRRGRPPLILDMALTPVALGKVLRAKAENASIPAAWGFADRDGALTTDPAVALDGVIPAIGGYKGVGLAVMMNILAGVLSGGAHTSGVEVGHRGQFFFVMCPDLISDRDDFESSLEEMASQFDAAKLLPGFDRVYLPGELEEARAERVLASGTISYPPSIAKQLLIIADDMQFQL